ncbi:MAG: AbrB/MazE/SpoVT family DNA-binding domain-containing protein [Candidatus Micrarchaeota archaeon]
MKLQKQLSRKIGSTEYSKWVVTIPPTTIKEIGWKDGQELTVKVKDGKIILENSSEKKS